jgi:phosphatidylglycerol---prolipoprotein diacylglyceryl transferase
VFPVLFHLGDFPVATYGITMGAGIFFGLLLGTVRARRDGLPSDWAWDLGLLAFTLGIAGARLEYVRTHPAVFLENPARVFALRDGGLVFYGGFVLTLIGFAVYARFRGRHFLDMTDMMSPSLAFGLALGRIGCLASGCCYGRPTEGWWAVTFPEGAVAPAHVPLLPTQLHEVIAAVAIGALLWGLPRKFIGHRSAVLFFLYGIFRFVNEHFRNDNRGAFLGTSLTNGQATSVLFILAAAVIWVTRRARPLRPAAG